MRRAEAKEESVASASAKQTSAKPSSVSHEAIMNARCKNSDVSSSDALLRRAVSSIYSDMQQLLLPLFEPHAAAFEWDREEQPLEYIALFKEYEVMLEQHLERFATAEGFESSEQFVECVSQAARGSARSERMLRKLLLAGDYKKFKVFMRQACEKLAAGDLVEGGTMLAAFEAEPAVAPVAEKAFAADFKAESKEESPFESVD